MGWWGRNVPPIHRPVPLELRTLDEECVDGRKTHWLYSHQCCQNGAPRLMDGLVNIGTHELYTHQCRQNRATNNIWAGGEKLTRYIPTRAVRIAPQKMVRGETHHLNSHRRRQNRVPRMMHGLLGRKTHELCSHRRRQNCAPDDQ